MAILLKASFSLTLFVGAVFCGPSARCEDVPSRIDRYLKNTVPNGQFEVLVARGGEVFIWGGYGQSEHHVGSMINDADYRAPIGAVAEQFVAAAVLRLEEQGKIRIDAPICIYVSGCPDEWKDVEIVQLLTHTSGLPRLKAQSAQKKVATFHIVRDLIEAIAGKSLEFKPGSRFKYNIVDDAMLYFAIESVSGTSISQYIETQVFRPLSMKDTKYPVPGEFYANGRESGSQDHKKWGTSESRLCRDNICSTVGDLYRWERALTKGAVISHDSLSRMFTPHRDGYGLGWKIIREFDKRLALQSGRTDGISVSVRLYPDDDTCIVLIASGDGVDSVALTHGIAAILFGRDQSSSINVMMPPTPPKLDRDRSFCPTCTVEETAMDNYR